MSPTLAQQRRLPSAVALPPPALIAFPSIVGVGARRKKRTVDVAIAALGLLVALPLIVAIAVAIALESGGPVLFSHRRVGRGGRRFRVWKFRTMLVDSGEILRRHFAENPEAALEWELTHKLKNDPRVTRVGRFLRRTSLDELPQIWNVLRGEMSIVGPRPIVSEEVAKYGPAFALYSQVKPGLTGLWQVSGRNNTSYRRRVELDSEYIRHWTLGLDLQLIARTVRVVLAGTGAY